MADKYVWSGALGLGTGLVWADAYLTLALGLAGISAGDRLFVAQDHSETQASAMTLTSPGTAAAPCEIWCASRAGSVPPVHADLATTALIVTTGANALSFLGSAYCYGITFRAGSGASAANIGFDSSAASGWILDTCHVEFGATNSSSRLLLGTTSAVAHAHTFINTWIKFGHVSQAVTIQTGPFEMRGGGIDPAGSSPTALFNLAARSTGLTAEAVDFSHMGSGKTIITPGLFSGDCEFYACKLGAAVTESATPTARGGRVRFFNSNSADTNYTKRVYGFFGTESEETTIVLTGGASDGTTTVARKIVTTADAKFFSPFRSEPIYFWVEDLAAITITLQCIWGGGAVPTDGDIWVEDLYSVDPAFPLGGYVNDGKASNLATAANQTAGAGTWGGSTTKFSLDVAVTPANKGVHRLTICAAAASSTFYIDPKPVIT